MIEWKDWRLTWDGAPAAMQFDNGSVWLDVIGDMPEGYDWELLLQEPEGGLDILPMQARPGGAGVLLQRENLPKGGTYTLQVRGTLRADGVTQRHSSVTEVLVPESLSEGAAWPELPTAFRQLETRLRELAAHPPQPGGEGYWMLWNIFRILWKKGGGKSVSLPLIPITTLRMRSGNWCITITPHRSFPWIARCGSA